MKIYFYEDGDGELRPCTKDKPKWPHWTFLGVGELSIDPPKKIVQKEAEEFECRQHQQSGTVLEYWIPRGAKNVKPPTYDIEE